MPLYDFACKSCEIEFEDLIKLSESNPKCPECGKDTERLVSVPAYGIVTGSEHRPLDCIIGADSEKKWEAMGNRKQYRKLRSKVCS